MAATNFARRLARRRGIGVRLQQISKDGFEDSVTGILVEPREN